MVKTHPSSIKPLFDSVRDTEYIPKGEISESGVKFGELIELSGLGKWKFIEVHVGALIESGHITCNLDEAMKILIETDKIYTLQCNVSMIECNTIIPPDGSARRGNTILFSTRVLTKQRNKKEDVMFATLGNIKYLLLRGAFGIFTINSGVIKCIKIHLGMVKFDTAAFNTPDNTEQYTTAAEKLDGEQKNIGIAELDEFYALEFGSKNTPELALIPKDDPITAMNAAVRTRACGLAFNILVNKITKYPELMDWFTRHTCMFELLDRRMFEIYVGSDFNKLKTPELVLLSVYASRGPIRQDGVFGVKIPIPEKMRKIFRTPRMFTIGSPDYEKYMRSAREGVIVLNKNGDPVLKKKTPAFVFFQVMSKLQLPTGMTREELYMYVLNIVMKKCYEKGADPEQAKQYYIDNADILSQIVYKIACEFACGNFTISDFKDPTTGDCCNWGKLISSVIMSITTARRPIKPITAVRRPIKLIR